jgi:hypothetical protein
MAMRSQREIEAKIRNLEARQEKARKKAARGDSYAAIQVELAGHMIWALNWALGKDWVAEP